MPGMKLHEHGEHVKPHYLPQPGLPQSRMGENNDASRPGGEVSGLVRRFAKGERAAQEVTTSNWVKAVYGNALEYNGIDPSMRGMRLLGGVCTGVLGLFLLWMLSGAPGHFSWNPNWVNYFVGYPMGILVFALCSAGFVWTVRAELFRPDDEPLIFDRQRRKVYRVLQEIEPGWRGMFKPWPLVAASYDWELIDAEHHVIVTNTGSGVTRCHALVMVVRKSDNDADIISSFNVGQAVMMTEHTVPMVWEHIRRYMEEDGPALPEGEILARTEPPRSWWQSVAAVGCYGPDYFKWWRDCPLYTLLSHVLFPMFLPLNLVWGTCNWLSFKTAVPVHWPQKVLDAVGTARSGFEL